MKRRNAFQNLKRIGLAGIASIMLIACNPTQSEKPVEQEPVTEQKEAVVEEAKAETNTLIVNRQLMHFADPNNPSDFEYKHTPEITLGDEAAKGFTTIQVRVGQNDIVHPVEDNHWIDFITLYADDQQVGHIEFEAGQSLGFATFYVQLDEVKALKAVAGCNLHGIWESVLSL